MSERGVKRDDIPPWVSIQRKRKRILPGKLKRKLGQGFGLE